MRRPGPRSYSLALCVALATGVLAAACGSGGDTASGSNGGFNGSGGAGTSQHGSTGGSNSTGSLVSSTGGGGVDHKDYPCSGCMAFPGLGAPACSSSMLGPPTLVYPSDGLLLPPNMNVLEVQFIPPASDSGTGGAGGSLGEGLLFEVDFENSVTDVRVETQCAEVPDVRGGPSRGCGVTLTQDAWNNIANTNRDGDPVTVTVRATKNGSCVTTSTASVKINFAKEDLDGGIYYWQSAVYGGVAGKTGGIYSHSFGTFDPTPTPFYVADATGTCVGCHNLSRDGARMSLAIDDPDADDEFSDVNTSILDVASRSVISNMGQMSPGFQTWTHDHAKMIASTYKGMAQNKGFDIFDGNTGMRITTAVLTMEVTQPDLSADDATLVYVMPALSMGKSTISMAGDHHFMGGSIYSSTFDSSTNTLGAPALQILGGMSANVDPNYYYPSFSPDKNFLVFNEGRFNTQNSGDAFYNPTASVKLLHFPAGAGATPIDLKALNQAAGLSNSWPRWSPTVQTYKNHKILWVTFSSNRDYGLHLVNQDNPMTPGTPYPNCYPPESPAYDVDQPLSKMGVTYGGCAQPQIWMAAIIVDTDASLDSGDRSFPAFWLPFQDVDSHNHNAQWVATGVGGSGAGGSGGSGGGSTACGEAGTACGAGHGPCCSDVFCCDGFCNDASACVH